MVSNFLKIDYKSREVVEYHGSNIAIVKNAENSYFVCSSLYEYPKGRLNYSNIEWFARSLEEANEKAKQLRSEPSWMI